jgi:hypothetical protein
VTIRTHDGRSVTNTVFVPKGAAALGIAWSDVDTKFRRLVSGSGLDAWKMEASLGLIHVFRTVADITPLIQLLKAG